MGKIVVEPAVGNILVHAIPSSAMTNIRNIYLNENLKID